MRKVGDDRQNRCARKPERLEILAVELRIAHRQIAAVRVRLQLATAAKGLARERPVHADEVLGRRDVVIDERHPVGQRVRRPRRLRAEREVVEQQVVAMAEIHELAIVVRLRLEAMVGGFDEDLGLVSGTAEHALNAQHFVADRVAVPERREHLVDADQFCLPAGPVGSFAITSSAGGRSCRRRSNHPGSGSAAAAGDSFFKRSNMSRYLRSMTGQS